MSSSSISDLLKQAEQSPDRAEQIYKEILSSSSGWFRFNIIELPLVNESFRKARIRKVIKAKSYETRKWPW